MRDIVVCLGLVLALASCDDEGKRPQCGEGGACTGDATCAGFESDFECVNGRWKCVPSGRVGDPCVLPDAGPDATNDAATDAPGD